MGSLSKAEKMDDTTLLSNDVTKIKSELHKQEKYKYLCKNCGYKTIKFSWQCQMCRSWESFGPINFITKN